MVISIRSWISGPWSETYLPHISNTVSTNKWIILNLWDFAYSTFPIGHLYVITKKVSFLGISVPRYLWYRVICNIFKVFSKQFQNKKRISTQMIVWISGNSFSMYPWFFIFFFCIFCNSVAFVLFKRNNEKLISLFKGEKKSENIILSNLLQRNFFSSFLSVQSCLRYGSQYQSGNIWPKEIKSGGMIVWWMGCPYQLVIAIINSTERFPSTLRSEISLKEKGVVVCQ